MLIKYQEPIRCFQYDTRKDFLKKIKISLNDYLNHSKGQWRKNDSLEYYQYYNMDVK